MNEGLEVNVAIFESIHKFNVPELSFLGDSKNQFQFFQVGDSSWDFQSSKVQVC